MADSFADLWATSAPLRPAQQPQRLGASTAPKSNSSAQRPQWDAFSALSASQPTTRTHTPHILHQTQAQAKQTAAPQRQNATDAFSGLFDSSMGLGSRAGNSTSNMSLAQRAALAQKTKQLQQQKGGSGSTNLNTTIPLTWDGLDSLAQANTRPAGNSSPQDEFIFAFEDAKPTHQTKNTVLVDGDDWGLSEFSSPQPAAQSIAQPKSPLLWDLDDFASPRPTQPSRSRTGTPGSFDFGDRQDCNDATLDGCSQDDDILGDLGKPVVRYTSFVLNSVHLVYLSSFYLWSHAWQDHSARVSPSPTASAPRSQPSSRESTASPPPHIVGQLVEMGFAPQLARTALLSTNTAGGFDTQAALDWLLAHREAVSMSDPSNDHLEEQNQRRTRERRMPRGPPNRVAPHSDLRNAQPTQSHPDTPDLPASAERIISQASEIGRGVFNRANALLKEGRERAMKIYEERASATSNRLAGKDVGTGSSEGRPRWMRDNPAEEGNMHRHRGFKDHDSGDEREFKPRSNGSSRKSPDNVQPLEPSPTQEVDLFGSDSPQVVYQSPFRRGKLKPALTPDPSAIPSQLPPSGPPRVPPHSLTTTISSAIFAAYASQKSAGTNAYKLGQYPAAADAYSRALAPLPERHVLCLPLLTNRAAARSKVGELSGAGEDCSAAIALVEELMGNVSAGSAKIACARVVVEDAVGTDRDTEVDLAGGLTKAYQRRAEAYEGLEKWAPALTDWEVLVGAEWAGASRALAARGAARCRRMIGGNQTDGNMGAGKRAAAPSNVAQRPPKPRPKPRTPTSPPTGDSPAVAALRSAANVAASEDAERHVHKDAVDAQLLAWRQGKETNIRALLTTLDGILWSELGWKKVGMAEVVGKGQVKVAYMRAIARVHPDKVLSLLTGRKFAMTDTILGQ